MIPISDLINKIRDRLNVDIPSFIDNTKYEFKIFENEGEYERPTRDGNTVTKYINCVASVIGDEKTGINEHNLTVSVTVKLDFLIPDCTVEYEGVSFGNAVIGAINGAFTLPDSYPTVNGGVVYNVVAVYSTITPGTKEIRPAVGESLTASAYVDFVITTQGYSSANVELYIQDINTGADYRVYYSRLDISRAATQESNIGAESGGVAKNITQGTSLVVSVIKPDRCDYLDQRISEYLLFTTDRPINYKLKWLYDNYAGAAPIPTENTFSMVFRDASKGAEGLDVPSNTCTLVECFRV